jgi:hypothetical protein
VLEDITVGTKDAVGEPVVAHELPDILDRVEFRAFGWQREERDVRRHDELVGQVPSGLVEDEHGVCPDATAIAISARCRFIAAMLQRGRTRAAPLPSLGQMAPKI